MEFYDNLSDISAPSRPRTESSPRSRIALVSRFRRANRTASPPPLLSFQAPNLADSMHPNQACKASIPLRLTQPTHSNLHDHAILILPALAPTPSQREVPRAPVVVPVEDGPGPPGGDHRGVLRAFEPLRCALVALLRRAFVPLYRPAWPQWSAVSGQRK